MESLLSGLTVLELSRGVAVRYCGRLFRQLGAEVIRADGGDDTAIGYAGAAGEAYGRWLDEGKHASPPGSTVNLVLAGQDAKAIARAEARVRDLPGNPPILAITWFHPAGPYANWRGTDEVIQALSGVAYPFGPAEGPPTLAQGHGPQLTAGLVAFNAAVPVLMSRQWPRRIDVNVLEAFMCLTEPGATGARALGAVATRLGVNRYSPTYPSQSYRTADGYVGVTALTPAQWQGFCRMVGRPDLAADVRFATSLERVALAEEIDEAVVPVFLTRSNAEWTALGDRERVPTTAMPNLRELPEVAHWRERGAFGAFDDSGLVAPTLPFRMRHDGVTRPRPEGPGPEAPLEGLKVVDFSMGWAGPLCARTLADLGADVVKVESHTHPDWWRGWEVEAGDPPPHEVKHSFIGVNRNKRGVCLDLTTPEGLGRAKALVARADVVVENYAAGVMEKLGLGPEVRRAIAPGLVAISMPAFGNGGPLSGARAYGSTVEQASGLPFANGRDDWAPCLQHVAFGDPLAGLFGAAAVLAALAGRAKFGGVEIDLAQVACLFQYGADAIIAQQLTDGPLPRTGNARPRSPLTCVVAGREPDSWLAVAVDGDPALRALGDLLGQPASEPAVAAWARTREPAEAAAELQARGVPAAPVQPTHILTYDPQLLAAGFWPELDRAYVGRHFVAAAPFAYDGARPALRRPAPTLGEHTDEVLAELAT